MPPGSREQGWETLKISKTLVEQLRGGWGSPMQISILKHVDGTLEMVSRRCIECAEAHKEHGDG